MGIYLSGAAKLEGVPKELALFFKNRMGIKNFIETGTFHGETTQWASEHFAHVETIEAYDKIHAETSTKLAHLQNVQFHLGDSSKLLPEIIKGLHGPTLFFLDAHEFYWHQGQDGASSTKTIWWDLHPVLKELTSIIGNFPENKIIIIDDMRLMTLLRYKASHYLPYPKLSEMIHVLDNTLEFFLFHDCMVILPKEFHDEELGTFLCNDAAPMYNPQNSQVYKMERKIGTMEKDHWHRFGQLSRRQKLQTIARVIGRKLFLK